MKKKYEKPEVYTEDVGTAFVADCCGELYEGLNAGAMAWCLGHCKKGVPYSGAGV